VRLIVGLGNPGPKYAHNRHNVGFMVVEALAARWRAPAFRDKFKGRFAKAAHGERDAILLQPMAYMNLSGDSVQPAMAFFKLSLEDVLVIHDEMDLPFGTVRLKVGGGAGGHNGLKSIAERCGGNQFVRLRIGIDRPGRGYTGESWVLSDFTASERAELPDIISVAVQAVESCLSAGAVRAMNWLHRASPSGAPEQDPRGGAGEDPV